MVAGENPLERAIDQVDGTAHAGGGDRADGRRTGATVAEAAA